MEKTLARAIYKQMEVGKEYTSSELRDLLGDEYYNYIPAELQGKDVRKIVSNEMWKVVNSGYAVTTKRNESLANVRGLKYGSKPTSFTTYAIRYWKRVK